MQALTDCSLLRLQRANFDALLGSLTNLRHMWRYEALRKARARARGCGRACVCCVCARLRL